MHEASMQFNVGLMEPQAVICLQSFSVRKYVYIHKSALIALNADKFYYLSRTLRKAFISTLHLRIDSGKIVDDIHSLT